MNIFLLSGNDFEALFQGVKTNKWRWAVVIEVESPHNIKVHYENQPQEVSLPVEKEMFRHGEK